MQHLWVALVGPVLFLATSASGVAEILAPFPIAVEDFPYVAVRRYTHRHQAAVLQCCPAGHEASDLRACLAAAAESVTLSAAVAGHGVSVDTVTDTASPSSSTSRTVISSSDAHDGSALAVLMMTSSKLSISYGAFSEATTAAWATGYRVPSRPEESQNVLSTEPVTAAAATSNPNVTAAAPESPTRPKGQWWARLDFLAVEIDDAASSGATYGAASASGGHAAHLAGGRAPHWQKVAATRNHNKKTS